MSENNYIDRGNYRMLIVHSSLSFLLKTLFLFSVLCSFYGNKILAQDSFRGETEGPAFMYDEIPVVVIIEGYGRFYLDVIYTKQNLLFVDIGDLFDKLKISNSISQKGDSISGFIDTESQVYSISYNSKKIVKGTKTIYSPNGLIKEMGAIYMESSLFEEVFGITLTYNSRVLTIILKSDFELPIIKQKRLDKLRGNMSKIKGEVIADTTLKRDYHLFKFGMVDWSAGSNQTSAKLTDNRFSIGVGTELLYGETDVSLNYSDRYKFDSRQINYLWRWVDNDKSLIKQAQIGKISNQTISFIGAPVVGAVVRNSPTTVRKGTGYYTINEITEPNWTIELYINNVLVDYTRSDASGLFTFKVPLVYGYTTLKLKFYGPMGEERTEERTMNMPYSIMPEKEFEYSLSAGFLQDSSLSNFGKADFNYGVSRYLTVGGGLEYLSSIPNSPYIPFATSTIQPFSKITINTEYAYRVRTRAVINYYFFKNALLTIDYIKNKEGQLATRYKYLEERKVLVSIPFRIKQIAAYAKLDYTRDIYRSFNFNKSNLIISAYYKQISVNSTTQLNWTDKNPAYLFSNLALSFRLKDQLVFRPSTQYNFSEGTIVEFKAEIEKNINKGYLTAYFERNVLYNENMIGLSFKYDLSFARTNISFLHRNRTISTSQSAQGSFAFGSGNKYVYATNNPSVGKGGISIYPFLDLNQNGIYDKGEQMVYVKSVKIFGGKVIFIEKDSIIRMPDLNPFVNYTIEFSDSDLENISWRFKDKILSVLIDPNQFKRIDIPVVSVGEVSGTTYFSNDNYTKGIGKIVVKYFKKDSKKVIAQMLSESDGYTYYMGLEPGEYVARVDSVQLSNLNYTVEPLEIPFTIRPIDQGDAVGGIDFILKPIKTEIETPSPNIPPLIPEQREDKLIYLIGNIDDSETGKPVIAKIEVIDIRTDSVVMSTSSSVEDGTYRVRIPSKKSYMIYLRSTGYLSDMKRIDIQDTAKQEIYKLDASLVRAEVGKKFVLRNIFFENDKSVLIPNSYEELDKLVRIMEDNPGMKIEISGHTDVIGTTEHNRQLSAERAKAVVDYLVMKGIDKMRMESKGFGYDQPLDTNTTIEGRANNRRVEFKILEF